MRSSKRVVAAVMAVILAAVGIAALVMYTQGAQDRAFAGRETVSVLQVKERVPAGTKASDLEDKLERVKLPRAAVPDDVVESLEPLGDKVTTATLVPGEVLVGARFAGSPSLKGSGAIEVPRGLQEITLQLESARALGGAVQPGDFVGVVASFEPPKAEDWTTNFAVNKVFVLAVSGGVAGEEAVPGASIQVRLAVTSEAAEKIVNAAEYGKVYLTRQNDGAKTGRAVITPGDVVR